jgi:hypothetical protein
LNDLCVQFYNHINSRVFDNEREVTHALNVFKDAVVNTSGGLRSNKTKLFSQIKAILLNPAADVQDHLARFRQFLKSDVCCRKAAVFKARYKFAQSAVIQEGS